MSAASLFSLPALERLVARFSGPMKVRFILQPLMAILLGIRDGIHDANDGTPPFVWDLCVHAETRKERLTIAFRRLFVPIAVATVIDGIVQYLMFQRIHVLGAVAVGFLMMGLPYSIARGWTNRIVTARRRFRLHPHPRAR